MSDADRFRRIAAIFRAVSDAPEADREQRLARECAGEPELIAEVRDLLAADQQAPGFLDRPAIVAVEDALDEVTSPGPQLPAQIGRYRILRRIGEGGMGSVFEAEQENPRRRVALKLMRRADGSRQVLQRFQQEAQILARLAHPGIAQILEAGATEESAGGCPYFVMELVQGRVLTDFVRESDLDPRELLRLFAGICDAVHYAHQRGVVHRDLKPANILVVDEPAQAAAAVSPPEAREAASKQATEPGPKSRQGLQAKILDFGVARLADADADFLTQHTTVGQLIGTVPYMSPEQAAGDPIEVDARSDVYSLGVILYELLTGRLPHDVRRLRLHEALRIICESEAPPAGSIRRSLRGDVENILRKALDRDPARRYASAADLALDIRNYLSERPVSARPASVLYRLRKFARRNRAGIFGLAVALLLIALVASVALHEASRADVARAEESRQREQAERESYRTCLVAASAAISRHEIAEALRYLDSAPEKLRGWEWQHLRSRLDDSLRTQTIRFTPWWMDFSPHGDVLAACSSAGRVATWRVADWQPLAELERVGTVPTSRIGHFAFSPDGKTIRADVREGSVRLDSGTLEPVVRETDGLWCRSRDGRVLVRRDDSTRPHTWVVMDHESDRVRLRIEGEAVLDAVLRLSPDGELLALARGRDPGLSIFGTADEGRRLRRADLDAVGELCFDHSGARIAVGMKTGFTHILDTATGETLTTLRGHTSEVVGVDFDADGVRIATVANDGTVRLWNSQTGVLLSTMRGLTPPVRLVRFTPDGRMVVTSSDRGQVRWWDAELDSDPFVLKTPGPVYGVAFSPDGRRLAAASLGGERPLRIWDVESGKERFAGLDGFLSALAFDRAGERIVVGRSTHGSETSVITADGQPIASLKGHEWRTDWVAFDPQGHAVISLGNNGLLRSQSIATGERGARMQFPGNLPGEGCRAALSPDGSLLAVASRNEIQLLDARGWESRATLSGHAGPIYALAFSPDGTRLVSGSNDRSLRVWNVQTGACLAQMTGHWAEIFAAVFSPDGSRIASGGRDRVVRIWDAAGGHEITQLYGHTSYIYSLAFSPDGRMLVSGGGDDTVRVWTTQPWGEVRRR